MNRQTLDATVIEKLLSSNQPVQICNEAGEVVGLFSPRVDPSEFENWDSPISEEELQRRIRSEGPRYSTAEVLRSLEKL